MVHLCREYEKKLEEEMGFLIAAGANGRILAWVWLHKGVDEFISNKQFRTFHLLSLKVLIDGLVAEGLDSFVDCEWRYYTSLEILRNVS